MTTDWAFNKLHQVALDTIIFSLCRLLPFRTIPSVHISPLCRLNASPGSFLFCNRLTSSHLSHHNLLPAGPAANCPPGSSSECRYETKVWLIKLLLLNCPPLVPHISYKRFTTADDFTFLTTLPL